MMQGKNRTEKGGGADGSERRMGIPSVSLYKEFGATAHAHLSLSSVVSKATKVPFLVGSLEDVVGWRKVISLPMTREAVPHAG